MANKANEARCSRLQAAVRMMEEHRHFQNASKRTSAIIDELLSIIIVGRSMASLTESGAGGGGWWVNIGYWGGQLQEEG
jgi:hypothetical protein